MIEAMPNFSDEDRPVLGIRMYSATRVEELLERSLESLEADGFPVPTIELSDGREFWSRTAVLPWLQAKTRKENQESRDAALAVAPRQPNARKLASDRTKALARERLALIREKAMEAARERHRVNEKPSGLAQQIRAEELRLYGLMANGVVPKRMELDDDFS